MPTRPYIETTVTETSYTETYTDTDTSYTDAMARKIHALILCHIGNHNKYPSRVTSVENRH